MERGFVEYLADPALERCLKVHLCNLGIPTDQLLSRISSFVNVVGVYVGLLSEVSSHDV